MERRKEFKKIGFIFGLEREMKLVSHNNSNIFCVYGYARASKNATHELLKIGVDIVINFGFAGSVSKDLKNGDIVFVDKIFNEKNENFSTFKFNKHLITNLENNFKFVRRDLLTVKEIAMDKKEKLDLVKKFKSISVIDMEAYHIKEELLKTNIPMISLKVIFDDLSFDIPSFIKDCINDEGKIKIKQFLIKLFLNPLRMFKLLKLNIKFSKSKKVLKSVINSF